MWTASERRRRKHQRHPQEPARPQSKGGGLQELTMFALLALQTLPRLFAQLSGPTPFPLPMLRIPLLIVGKAI